MDATKIEIAFRRHVGNIGRDLSLLAKLPDDSRGGRIIDCDQDHTGSIQIFGLEYSIDMRDLTFANSEGDFRVQARLGAHDSDIGVGVEAVEDPTSGNLRGFVRTDEISIALHNRCRWNSRRPRGPSVGMTCDDSNVPHHRRQQAPSCA